MGLISTYLVPMLYAVLFHVLVIGLLLMNWDEEKPFESTELEPYFIEASIVNENPHKAKARRETADAAAREQARRDRAAEAQTQREAEARAAANRQARIDADRLAREAQAREEREAAEQRARELANAADAEAADDDSEVAREQMADELARAVMSEQSARRAVTDYEKAMAYAARIRQDIVQQWSRPPSARNGMQALLQVNLVPTGEVVDVKVVEGSGNDAFDRSAIQAVEKAERFVVPNDSKQFETHFRKFEVLFRPEDLRL